MKLNFFTEDASISDPDEFLPNGAQRTILVQAKMADTPTVAYGFTQGDVRLHSAATILDDLGFVAYGDGELSLTETGEDLMKRIALVDEQGELTQEAQGLISSEQDLPEPAEPETDDLP